MPLLRHQPFKGLYLAVELAFTLSWRPRPSWPPSRVVHKNLVKVVMKVVGRTGPIITSANHLAILPGVDVNGVWVEPTPQLVTGPLVQWCQTASVGPIPIPGYWVHKKNSTIPVAAAPMPGEKVIYSLHGGAYVRQSAHPTDPVSAIGRGFLKHVDSVHRVFSIEYRLSSARPDFVSPFPAALLDALAGYNYLVTKVGFDPADIIFVGDSAGGNLALALVRYLVDQQTDPKVASLGLPGSLVLLSPWVDISYSHDISPATDSSTRFAHCDYIDVRDGHPGITYAKSAFIGPHGRGAAEFNPYISPASRSPSVYSPLKNSGTFKAYPRTFIVAGGAEVLYDQITTFANRMINDLGLGDGVQDGEGKVVFYVAPDGIHDYLVFPWHEPERSDTLRAIAAWINKA
ncbi:hypothetical protein ONZ45_g16453 [Pleurotus djamor]|nr:hypothetical protein ONZ45_g16453 [Pleurotus djamor]